MIDLNRIISNKEIYEELRVEAICNQIGLLEELLLIGRSLGSPYIELNIDIYENNFQNRYKVKSISIDGLDNELLILIRNNSFQINELNSHFYPENDNKYFLNYLIDISKNIPNRGILISSYATHLKTNEENLERVIIEMLNKFNISKGEFREIVGFPKIKFRVPH